MFVNVAISNLLYLVKPSRTHHWFVLRSWDHIPHTVLNHKVILLYRNIKPDWLLHCFLERRRFGLYTLPNQGHVTSLSLRWRPLSALRRWLSHILSRIHNQPISFPWVFLAISGRLSMSGCIHYRILYMLLLRISLRLPLLRNLKFLLCMQLELPLKWYSHGFLLIELQISVYHCPLTGRQEHPIVVWCTSVPHNYPQLNCWIYLLPSIFGHIKINWWYKDPKVTHTWSLPEKGFCWCLHPQYMVRASVLQVYNCIACLSLQMKW